MTMTPQSSGTTYLPAAEFLKRTDVATVGDLCGDNRVRIAPTALVTDPNLAAALLDASGELESACMVGQKYQPADIAALVANVSAGQAKVYRLLTAITKVFLVERRPGANVPEEFMAGVDRAVAQLEAIAKGTMIFSFTEAAEAGKMHNPEVEPWDVVRRKGPVVQAERYFGIRSDRAWGRIE
jgi:hypothetical protein